MTDTHLAPAESRAYVGQLGATLCTFRGPAMDACLSSVLSPVVLRPHGPPCVTSQFHTDM
eukprot:6128744-Heterocapsa_arctica.AAC.1